MVTAQCLVCLSGQTWSQRDPWSGWAWWRAGESLVWTTAWPLWAPDGNLCPLGEPSQGPGLQGLVALGQSSPRSPLPLPLWDHDFFAPLPRPSKARVFGQAPRSPGTRAVWGRCGHRHGAFVPAPREGHFTLLPFPAQDQDLVA